MTKVLEVKLTCELVKGKDGKLYRNFFITTPNGTSFEIGLKFYNRKLHYKIFKEIENAR